MKIATEKLSQTTTKHKILVDGKNINFSEWIHQMQTSDDFIQAFNQSLVDSDFKAFFWEVKPVDNYSVEQDFEFVLVNSNSLRKIAQNDSSFRKYFKDTGSVVNFANLRGDAELVVPTPVSGQTKYAHIAKFVRTAEQHQVIDFWRRVALVYSKLIGEETKWLSTSGLGVSWLHIRIDSRPKYYQYGEYKLKT